MNKSVIQIVAIFDDAMMHFAACGPTISFYIKFILFMAYLNCDDGNYFLK